MDIFHRPVERLQIKEISLNNLRGGSGPRSQAFDMPGNASQAPAAPFHGSQKPTAHVAGCTRQKD
jgi:hypothetical protein